jgi:4-aminobutyrate aminotransferase-like enzyme/Ser/Thr protein kinase RdoA (MazF antagonist)
MLEQRPNFEIDEVKIIVNNLFKLSGSIIALPSERDQNFLITEQNNKKFVLKIANHNETFENLDFQNKALQHISLEGSFNYPKLIKSDKKSILTFSKDKKEYFVRLLSFLEGVPLAEYKPITEDFLIEYGKFLGYLTKSLINFDHPSAHKEFHWDIQHADKIIAKYKNNIKESKKIEIVNHFQTIYLNLKGKISKLPNSVIHNDANDYNVIINYYRKEIEFGIIDFGDMVYSHTIINLAVGIAYAILNKPDPTLTIISIVKGYNDILKLKEIEIEVLFCLIATRLTVSVCISAYQQSIEPDNKYLIISEKPAWLTLIQLKYINMDWIELIIRNSCNFQPYPMSNEIKTWISINKDSFHPLIVESYATFGVIDLDINSNLGNFDELSDSTSLQKIFINFLNDNNKKVGLIRNRTLRLDFTNKYHIYPSNDLLLHKNYLSGIDIFSKSNLDVYVPLEGQIFKVLLNPKNSYTIIIEHQTESDQIFYSIFTNLHVDNYDNISQGLSVLKGSKIGYIQHVNENSNPFRFQIICTENLSFLQESYLLREKEIVDALFFNPYLLFPNIFKNFSASIKEKQNLELLRVENIGSSLSIAYSKHLHIVRGYMQYLFDSEGRKYLDAVNNVPHVGHSNPNVVSALSNQAKVLNTNTRYLHENILLFAKKLTSKLPDKLQICYFVNSGSEANELALRLAENFTKKRGVVVLDHAYHGNTSKLIDISPYKHNGPGGNGTPEYVHILDLPDTYRGKFGHNDKNVGLMYAKEAIEKLSNVNNIGTFIFESYPGVAGQILLAEGYLKEIVNFFKQKGVVCIADEVQIGLGRVGTNFWGFENHSLIPDIVTIGKPIGNGHPLGAVITTKEISDAFNNGMEYFNTFGGNPVSCAVGLAVLEELEQNELQNNALNVGKYILESLNELKEKFKLIGNVRGKGLFIGIELVRSRETLEPADWESSYICERMKDLGVLISTDGPYHNVLKIKPPLIFTIENVMELKNKLDIVLQDTVLSKYNDISKH